MVASIREVGKEEESFFTIGGAWGIRRLEDGAGERNLGCEWATW